MPLIDEAAAVHATFASAYPGYVAARVAGLGVDAGAIEPDIAAGAAWLDSELTALLGLPFDRQARSPLEVFQEAMRFPTEALAAAGLPEVERDPVARAALPGDRYGLAPASSQDLGEEAWQAHIVWGAAKARELARPTALLVSSDLMDRPRIEASVAAAGYRMLLWHGAPPEQSPVVGMVDLAHADADDAIATLAARGVRVLAYGPHVDDFALTRARTLGAAEALPRSRFFRALGSLLPPIV